MNTDIFSSADHFSSLSQRLPPLFLQGEEVCSCEVSVVIPTYRRAHLLRQAVDSVLNQCGNVRYEIVVVDNECNPNSETAHLMGAYVQQPLRYYQNSENLGQITNWNVGILLARGEWVVLLHDDDQLLPGYFCMTMEAIRRVGPLGGLFTIPITRTTTDDFQEKRSGGGRLQRWAAAQRVKRVTRQKGRMYRLTVQDYYFDCGYNAPIAALYHRPTLLQAGGFDPEEFPISDWVFHTMLCSRSAVYVLSEFGCVRGVGSNDSLKKEAQIGFIEKGKEFRSRLYRRFHFFGGRWWWQAALWYHAIHYYHLTPKDLPAGLLDPEYNNRWSCFFYKLVVFLYLYFKPYYLQTEIIHQHEGEAL